MASTLDGLQGERQNKECVCFYNIVFFNSSVVILVYKLSIDFLESEKLN